MPQAPRSYRNRTWRLMLSAVAVQCLLALFSLPAVLRIVRDGDVSVAHLILAATVQTLIIVGGLLLFFGHRSAAFAFAASSVLAVALAISWRPPMLLTGIVVASMGVWLSPRILRRKPSP